MKEFKKMSEKMLINGVKFSKIEENTLTNTLAIKKVDHKTETNARKINEGESGIKTQIREELRDFALEFEDKIEEKIARQMILSQTQPVIPVPQFSPMVPLPGSLAQAQALPLLATGPLSPPQGPPIQPSSDAS